MDIANGPGIRVSLFVSGCTLHCPGCFNAAFQDFQYGQAWEPGIENQFIALGKRPHIEGYSILGGEPLDQDEAIVHLLERIKKETGKLVWLWTGYRFEDLTPYQKGIVSCVDVLVDGNYEEALQDMRLKFKGSSNQRVLDAQDSILKNKAVLWEGGNP